AIPEGGTVGTGVGSNLPYTFYDRYTVGFPVSRTTDRRQPLPSVFAPRFIDGGPGGFNSALKIWREGTVGGDAACSDYIRNSAQPVTEIVRFDEHENATVHPIATVLPPPAGLPAPP